MPVLFKLVAVCDDCGARQDYEAPVVHSGDAPWDSMNGSGPLRSDDVEHDFGILPDGWGLGGRDMFVRPLHCSGCLKKGRERA